MAVLVGRPDIVQISEDSGTVFWEMYDDNGFCCGGVEIRLDGSLIWSLHKDDEVMTGRYKRKEPHQ